MEALRASLFLSVRYERPAKPYGNVMECPPPDGLPFAPLDAFVVRLYDEYA